MLNRSKQRILGVIQTAALCLLGIAMASGQVAQPAAQQEKPQMADDVFKNIQVLRGLTVDDFMGTMGFIAASLSLNCSECHAIGSAEGFAEDNPMKDTARKMIVMVNNINKTNFAGQRLVTCYTCHRSSTLPKVAPSLLEQYGTPPPDDPNEVQSSGSAAPGAPTADQILDRYVQALGGAQRVARLTSFVARGTYEGFDTEAQGKVPVEIYAKAPGERTTVVHLQAGDNIRTFDGRNGWVTTAGTFSPVPVMVLSDGDYDGAQIEARLSFPAQIKQSLKNWRTGFDATVIDDKPVDVVQGTSVRNIPVKFYFDKKSGLLLRLVRYIQTPIGPNPTEIDYSDYRDVNGVKMPFRWTVIWTDGRSTFELYQVQADGPIDAAKFARPVPTASQKP